MHASENTPAAASAPGESADRRMDFRGVFFTRNIHRLCVFFFIITKLNHYSSERARRSADLGPQRRYGTIRDAVDFPSKEYITTTFAVYMRYSDVPTDIER